MGKYTAVDSTLTWPKNVARCMSREFGLMPSRYQRSNVATAKERRKSWSLGETTPGGICNFSLGKSLWNVWLIVPGWRSEERRVGKECRSGGAAEHGKGNKSCRV